MDCSFISTANSEDYLPMRQYPSHTEGECKTPDTLEDVRPKGRTSPYSLPSVFFALPFCLLIGTSCACFAEVISLDHVAAIETGGERNPNLAVGDDGKSFGKFQISKIALRDFRQLNPASTLTTKDLHDEAVAAHLALWLLEVRIPQLLEDKGYKATPEAILTAYNCGISCVGKPLPKTTRNYIRKYKQLKGAA